MREASFDLRQAASGGRVFVRGSNSQNVVGKSLCQRGFMEAVG